MWLDYYFDIRPMQSEWKWTLSRVHFNLRRSVTIAQDYCTFSDTEKILNRPYSIWQNDSSHCQKFLQIAVTRDLKTRRFLLHNFTWDIHVLWYGLTEDIQFKCSYDEHVQLRLRPLVSTVLEMPMLDALATQRINYFQALVVVAAKQNTTSEDTSIAQILAKILCATFHDYIQYRCAWCVNTYRIGLRFYG